MIANNTIPAATTAGEMSFIAPMTKQEDLLKGLELSPSKYLFTSIRQLFIKIPSVFRDKKRLLPVIIIFFLWLIPLLLSSLGMGSTIQWLSFLTFAQGGTSGGLLGMVGGLVGKGFFAYFFFTMIQPLFTRGKPFLRLGYGINILFRSFSLKDKSALFFSLMGAGFALITYNMLTGNASLQNSMAGIAVFLLSLKTLTNKGGFFRGFLTSLLYRSGKGQIPDISTLNRIIAGWTMGFAITVILSATDIPFVGYLSGIFLLLVALIVKIAAKNRKVAIKK